MIKKAIVCCCSFDEQMLSVFVNRWRQIYQDVELWLGDDEDNPVTIQHDLPIVKISWKNKPAKRIVNAMLAVGGDIVAKLDVDTWHVKNNLFDPFNQSWVMATGHQWPNEPCRFLGIAYAIRRSALIEIDATQSCLSMCGNEEDAVMNHSIRKVYPNGIYLQPYMQCRRSDTWNNEDASVIHCGLYGHSQTGRNQAFEELERLNKNENVESKESAWLGMSVMPTRLHGVDSILSHVSSGIVKPNGIILSIPKYSERTEDTYDETEVEKLKNKSIIYRIKDYGPISKYVGLCENVDSDGLCIVIDDDCKYSPQMIARMTSQYREGFVLANRIVTISDCNLPEGFAAVIFRRSLIDLTKLKRLINFLNQELPEALLADDAIIGWFFKSQNITVEKMEKPVHVITDDSNYDDSALHKIGNGHIPRYADVINFLDQNKDRIIDLMSIS